MAAALAPMSGNEVEEYYYGSDSFDALTIDEVRRHLYREAARGLEPVLWGLFQDPGATGLLAEPIEKLVRDQWNQYMEVRQFVVKTQAAAPPMHSVATISVPWMTRRFAIFAANQLYQQEKALRQEQARHYGMLVCRAFFKFTVREHMSEEAGRLSLEVVELVEQFLNG